MIWRRRLPSRRVRCRRAEPRGSVSAAGRCRRTGVERRKRGCARRTIAAVREAVALVSDVAGAVPHRRAAQGLLRLQVDPRDGGQGRGEGTGVETSCARAALQIHDVEVAAAAISGWSRRGVEKWRIFFLFFSLRLGWADPWSAVELAHRMRWKREDTWEEWSGPVLIRWLGHQVVL
jgi:hypothetical protein